jgi:hypothetical protein
MGVLRPELARFSGISAREVRRTYYLALVRTHTRHVQHLPHRGFRHANLACDVTILLAFCRAIDNVSAYRLSDHLAGSGSILRAVHVRASARPSSAVVQGKAHG